MFYTRQQIAQVCRQLGPSVGPLPNGIDGAQLLWALSGNESSFGLNCTPRHEPGYDVGGRYATHSPMPELRMQFGRAAACSYGPWQLMLAFAGGHSPNDMSDLLTAANATIVFLNCDLRRFETKIEALCDIGEVYNAGHVCPDLDYTTKLDTNYLVPMPVGLAPVQSA